MKTTPKKEYYKSIFDCPMYNWLKCREKEDFSYLYVRKEHHGTDITSEEIPNAYLDMITEFFEEFGQTKELKNDLKLQLRLLDLNIKYIETGDRFLLNEIKIIKDELHKDVVNKADEILEIKTEIARVGKASGVFAIDLFNTTVEEYYRQRLLLLDAKENG